MKKIDKRKHLALLKTIETMSTMLKDRSMTIEEQPCFCLERLNLVYAKYEELLDEIQLCVAQYQDLTKELKTTVIIPQVRNVRKYGDRLSNEHGLLVQNLSILRA